MEMVNITLPSANLQASLYLCQQGAVFAVKVCFEDAGVGMTWNQVVVGETCRDEAGLAFAQKD